MRNKTNGIDEVDEKIEYNSNMNVTALKNSTKGEVNEYKRKLELGREIKAIALKRDMSTVCLKLLNGDLGRKSYLNM